MTWQTFLFIIVAGSAFGYSGYRLKLLFQIVKAHQGRAMRVDRIPERIKSVLINVLGQKATLRKRTIGIIHTTIFWGFLIITLGTLEQFASTLYKPAHFEFIGHGPYQALIFLQDIFTLAVLLAVGAAGFRRWIVRPEGLGKSADANIILTLTGSLMVSILLMNGFHLLGSSPWYGIAMPVSGRVAEQLTSFGLSP